MAGFMSTTYNLLFKRTSTTIFTIFVGALLCERTVDYSTQAVFDHINRGKQWKDIKHNYEK
ncbi:cytochrome b-c1 complex subunit 9-like protein [Dinothrombium tinctorium]|uniref:Complex III subunit 9 n=1 Tax=Dinothrombium tinctorium TaxID=1965070 RepID=A0A3S3PWM3_9ACAR|nr:cytochrome b-c1 complex subunit 9-like protein [Dinothrombium tinctorium]RWS09498.1 cytochrome b-c1 complex subunit 9-like protein [Dinothrombium tinctorium]RWS09527.1 cytochrome b-c1 complex subunit 9-like protein [Dinothrombium tinctorium]RWS09795.1 cytochrome b-c1 complex subunit 9-like protein [Dinothrombium tinctorium]